MLSTQEVGGDGWTGSGPILGCLLRLVVSLSTSSMSRATPFVAQNQHVPAALKLLELGVLGSQVKLVGGVLRLGSWRLG